MRATKKFHKQALLLLFIIATLPALTVSIIWYLISTGSISFNGLSMGGLVLPAAIIGLLPAVLLALLLARIIAWPIENIRRTIYELARGNANYHMKFHHGGEFEEMAENLAAIGRQIQDMLSQKTGETDLIIAERNKLRAVLDSMADGVFAIDSSDRIMLFNKAAQEITGRSMAEVAGQLSEKVIPMRRQGEMVMARWLANRKVAQRELGEWRNLQIYRADGESIYVDVRAVKLPSDPNGIRALVTFHDLTKSHNLEEMKIDFVALAAHELRTPLTAIRGYLDVLRLELEPVLSADQLTFLQRSITSSQQLSNVVNNILNVSRIERGEMTFKKTVTSLGEILDGLKIDYINRAIQENRNITMQIEPNLPEVQIDTTGITEVMNNLVENALNYTKPGATIEIIAKPSLTSDEIEVTITDNGLGIPKEAIKKLFTKFYRVEGIHTTKGTGLGLFISKAIIEAHGGHIWVESKFGVGTTFGFNIPTYHALVAKQTNAHNETNSKGLHGWIKEHSIR